MSVQGTIILIMFFIVIIGSVIIWIQSKSIKDYKHKNKDLTDSVNSAIADNIRITNTLEQIQKIRKEANDKNKKVDSADNSDLAFMLNQQLSNNT